MIIYGFFQRDQNFRVSVCCFVRSCEKKNDVMQKKKHQLYNFLFYQEKKH